MNVGEGGQELTSGSTAQPFGARSAWHCPDCGGTHTRRQRCPAIDEQPVAQAPEPYATPPIAALPQRAVTYRPSSAVHAVWAPRGEYVPRWSAYLESQRRPPARPVMNAAGGVQNVYVQWLAAIVCTAVLITSVSVAGVFIARMAEADRDPATQLAVVLVAVAAGLLAGVLPIYFAARAFAGAAYALLALTLLTGGVIMLVAAPVVRQMNTPGLAEYRGFWTLLTFGMISTACGAALTALCVRWSLYAESRDRLSRWSRPFAAGYGLLLIVTAELFALFIPLGIAGESGDGVDQVMVQNAIILGSLVSVTALPGVVLLHHGVGALRGWHSRELRLPVALLFGATFLALLGAGHLIMREETPLAAPMPVLHVLCAAVPGLTYAALAARGSLLRGRVVGGLSWRQVTTAAAISLTAAVAIAIYIEALGSAVAVTALLVNSGAFEFADSGGEVFDIIFEHSNFRLSDTEQLIANLIAASLLAPVAEEFAKGLGVRFLMRPDSTRAQCFVLGAVAGAAFGFPEALMYGAGWIADDLGLWWQGMTVRAGSTSGHVFWSGITGIAWWYWSIGRRHRLAVVLFVAAMLGHAAWNGVFTIIDSRIYFLDELDIRTVEIIAYAIVGVWSLAQIAAIPLVARRLREAPTPAVSERPLASMEAWLA
jgi:hypothetical protein